MTPYKTPTESLAQLRHLYEQLKSQDGMGRTDRARIDDGILSTAIAALEKWGQPAQAQADSVPAVSDLPPLPAPDLRDVGTKPQEIKEFLKGYATEYARTAIAARARAADSVQEDAARKQGEKQ